MWPLNLLSSTKNRQRLGDIRRPQRAARPCRTRIPLSLEPLEERWLLNGTLILSQVSPPASSLPPPSSIFQAASTLFFDGVELGIGKANQLFGIPEVYAYPVPVSALNASVDFYSPYVGPWARLFVLAGEILGAEVQYQVQLNSLQSF